MWREEEALQHVYGYQWGIMFTAGLVVIGSDMTYYEKMT